MERIRSEADIVRALDELEAADPRLAGVRRRVSAVDLRLSEPNFASLAAIVVAQQVSRASAQAMLDRLSRKVQPLSAGQLLAAGPAALVEARLSQAKQRALLALAASIEEEKLDLAALAECPSAEAIATLSALPGIGPWTAEVFLLTAGHPDVFPSRDVALQAAVAEGLGLTVRPADRVLAAMALAWSPWRSVAARLFWALYREMKGREVLLSVAAPHNPWKPAMQAPSRPTICFTRLSRRD